MIKFRYSFYSLLTLFIVGILSFLKPEEAATFSQSWLYWHEPVLAGLICGILAALMGVFMLLNRIVFVSLAVAQGAGLGIFLSFFVAGFWGISIEESPIAILSGFAMASLTSLFFTRFRRKSRYIPDEVWIGLIYIFSSAFIVLIGDRIGEGHHHIDNLIFGSAVAITSGDLAFLASVTALVLGVQYVFRREFAYSSTDPEFMAIRGMKTRNWQTLLNLTLTLSITVSLKTLGSLPVFGMMLVPPYLALKNAGNLRDAFLTSLFIGMIIPPLGYYFSFLFDYPTGASIIFIAFVYCLLGRLEIFALQAEARRKGLTGLKDRSNGKIVRENFRVARG